MNNLWLSIQRHLKDASATMSRDHRTKAARLETLRFVRTDLRECLAKVEHEIDRLSTPPKKGRIPE